MLPGEDLPRVPLYPVCVDQENTEDLLKPGAHLVYKVCQEPCRPCYRSALVLKVEGTKIYVIMNTSEHDKKEQKGVKAECLVLKVEGTKIYVIMNTSEHDKTEHDKTEQKGVNAECFECSRTDLYIIKYSHCCEYSHYRYTDDEAVTRAEQ